MERELCTVTVSIGEKEFSGTYEQVRKDSVSVDDMLKLLSDDKTAKQLIKDWWYGQDLKAKTEVRNAIISKEAGPERAFEKNVRDFIKLREANGKPITEEKAREMVKLMMDSE